MKFKGFYLLVIRQASENAKLVNFQRRPVGPNMVHIPYVFLNCKRYSFMEPRGSTIQGMSFTFTDGVPITDDTEKGYYPYSFSFLLWRVC